MPRPAPQTLTLLKTRLKEAGAVLHRARGAPALARVLQSRAGAPLWLEAHPWLEGVADNLKKAGLGPRFAREEWAPDADTVVTVALAAVPETGSLLLKAGGPGAWLPFRARKQVVLVPHDRADLSLAAALKLTREHLPGLVSWLTGPTRTADIEKVLVLGAQGPEELEVVIYQPGEGR